eukprot:TRINITY_DN7190_c0_g2_i4.p1 TRINITY_DN7190_c0_g2~~TRINITY_DN7190_c0_g2_i4.p1  ORF type:complete len:305 (-),score=42.36 TRINITY_DN7190_c0_g2_i4:117-1031(-)
MYGQFLSFGGDLQQQFEDFESEDDCVPDITNLINQLNSTKAEEQKEALQGIKKLDWQLEIMVNDEKYPSFCAAVFGTVIQGLEGSVEATEKLIGEVKGIRWGEFIDSALTTFVSSVGGSSEQRREHDGIRSAIIFLVDTLRTMSDNWVSIDEQTQKALSRSFTNFVNLLLRNKDLRDVVESKDKSFCFWQRNVSRIPILQSIIENMDSDFVQQVFNLIKNNRVGENQFFFLIILYVMIGVSWYGNQSQKELFGQVIRQNDQQKDVSFLCVWQKYLQNVIKKYELISDQDNIKQLWDWMLNLEQK